jgi:hypothetical protein
VATPAQYDNYYMNHGIGAPTGVNNGGYAEGLSGGVEGSNNWLMGGNDYRRYAKGGNEQRSM